MQPLRRGDEMEVTDDYIIYRPANVDVGEFPLTLMRVFGARFDRDADFKLPIFLASCCSFAPTEDFENFIGIWTADLIERKHLNEFMLK